MVKEPLVSVILPNYNHAAYLDERLDSILNQTYTNFELIILDDASRDKSLSILEKYRNYSKVSHFIVNEKNTGSPFQQWKKGMELASGEYIWIAESDDTCDYNFLETQLENLKHSAASVAKTFSFTSSGEKYPKTHPVFWEGDEVILSNDNILFCPVLNVSAMVFHAVEVSDLSNSCFSEFSIIGDRVFYFEFFQHKKMSFNTNTINYFRQESAAVSNLDSKNLNYLIRYFKEHVRFIRYAASRENGDLDDLVMPYIQRFYNRVCNRLSRRRKISLNFLKLSLYFKLQKLRNP